MNIKKKFIEQKSTTIVMIDSSDKIHTFTGWNFIAKYLDVDPQKLRQLWSNSDKNEPIEFKGVLIQKCVDNIID